MIVTTYTCDKCNYSQSEKEKPRQLWEVGITVNEVKTHRSYSARSPHPTALWCRNCVVGASLQPPTKDEPTPKPITLEDIVREIVEEIVSDAQS